MKSFGVRFGAGDRTMRSDAEAGRGGPSGLNEARNKETLACSRLYLDLPCGQRRGARHLAGEFSADFLKAGRRILLFGRNLDHMTFTPISSFPPLRSAGPIHEGG